MKYILKSALILLVLSSCSKLDEKLGSQVNQVSGSGGGSIPPGQVLTGTYNAMRNPYQDQARLWALQEHASDEVIGPTRAGDWDDNGVWRVLHTHQCRHL
jgi:starch-binding outer membrane protein, SusD/RagB family